MSLRREEAELRRALQLSTQQAHALAQLPPHHRYSSSGHSLSSSRTSADWKELELRPVMQPPVETQQTPVRTSYTMSPDIDSPPRAAGRNSVIVPATAVPETIATFSSNLSSRETQPSSRIGTFSRLPDVDFTPGPEYNDLLSSQRSPTRPRDNGVEVIVPARPLVRPERQGSMDPIDSFAPSSPLRVMDSVVAPTRESTMLNRMSSSDRSAHPQAPTVAPSSSGTGDSDRRVSSRVRQAEERKEAAKLARKRKREADKEAKRLAEEQRQRAIEAGELPPDPKKPTKKDTKQATKETLTSSQSSVSARSARSMPLVDSTPLPNIPESNMHLDFVEPPPSKSKPPAKSPVKSQASAQSSKSSKSQTKSQAAVGSQDLRSPSKGSAAVEPHKSSPFFADSASKNAATSTPAPPSSPLQGIERASSPIKAPAAAARPAPETPRPVLQPTRSTPASASDAAQSPTGTPGNYNWKAPRNDLSSVLSKFPGARRTGMSRRLKIIPLHQKIGPGVKALPPPPLKPSRKKVESEDEDEDEADGKVKEGSREWLMMED